MIVTSWAKVNLGLIIHSQREDGYHEIETVMQQIGLCDYLVFEEKNNGIEITTIGANISEKDNLVYKAAVLLQQEYSIFRGIKIKIYKNIPIGAGLGGGSGNAAVALISLCKKWDINMPLGDLFGIAEKLGADVPYFLLGGTVLAKGKGEKLTLLPQLPFLGVVLAKPFGLSISTKEMYNKISQNIPPAKISYDGFIYSVGKKDREAILNWMGRENMNMLEEVILKDNPSLLHLKGLFKKAGLNPSISGSGPSVFAMTSTLKDAIEAANFLEQFGYQAWASWSL